MAMSNSLASPGKPPHEKPCRHPRSYTKETNGLLHLSPKIKSTSHIPDIHCMHSSSLTDTLLAGRAPPEYLCASPEFLGVNPHVSSRRGGQINRHLICREVSLTPVTM